MMATTVVALKQGKRMRRGHVGCHGRIDGQPIEVVVHEFRRGKATCVWQLPEAASGKLVTAVDRRAARACAGDSPVPSPRLLSNDAAPVDLVLKQH